MDKNIIDAIINLVKNCETELFEYDKGKNRINNAGKALEVYVKKLFANSFNVDEEYGKKLLEETFSYQGNDSNPPDAMLRNGDAIEVKKIENPMALLALNSSFPKHKLYANSKMISQKCRDAEDWDEKDIIYTVGVVEDNKLRHLCMVYGTDYCASKECYERIRETIKNGIEEIPDIVFSETKELGRINKIDPLGVTYLRVRGMWGIENPWKIFDYVYNRDMEKKFTFMCIINDQKWSELKNVDVLIEMSHKYPALKIEKVKIKNPDNPALFRDARLITFEI